MDLQAIVGVAMSGAVSVIGFLVVRVVSSIDGKMDMLASKVDALISRDTVIEVQATETRVRLEKVEDDVEELKQWRRMTPIKES